MSNPRLLRSSIDREQITSHSPYVTHRARIVERRLMRKTYSGQKPWSAEDSTNSFGSNEEQLSNYIAFTFRVDIVVATESDTDEASKVESNVEFFKT